MIQKFCYHGNVTPHFSLFPSMKSLVIFSMDCLLFKHSKWHFLLISASVEVLDEVEVEYISLPGWMTSIENCRTFSKLPVNAQSYVRKIEEITQIPGQFIIKSMHTSSCFLVTKPTTLLNILVWPPVKTLRSLFLVKGEGDRCWNPLETAISCKCPPNVRILGRNFSEKQLV